MDIYECIKTRRSIRKYLDLEVPKEKIGLIIDAGASAPSTGNIQDWRFTIIKDPEKRAEIANACLQQTWMSHAPVHILVCGATETNKQFYGVRGERLYCVQDCAAAS